MRRFEHAGKFWAVSRLNTYVQMKWGDIGTPGRVFDRHFPSEAEAEVFVERQIIAQRERGYVETNAPAPRPKPEVIVERHQRFVWTSQFEEVTQEGAKLTVRGGKIVNGRDVLDRDRLDVIHLPTVHTASVRFDERCADMRVRGGVAVDPEPTHAIATNAELEAACEAAPDDPAPWAVYADWLIANGDARGEIAALHLAGAAADAKRLLGVHLLDLAGTDGAGILAFDLQHGFATGCTIRVDPEADEILEDITRAVLASPIGRFLRVLRFGLASHDDANDWGPTIHAVASAPRAAQIRELWFDAHEDGDGEIAWSPYGDLSNVWARLPHLELLHVRCTGSGTLGRINSRSLRTLVRETESLTRPELAELVSAELPALEHLAIWFGDAELDVDAIRPILDGRFPALRHIGLVGCGFLGDALAELARAPLLAQLRSLDLSRVDRYDALVTHANAFRHLEAIDISSNDLTEDDVARIRAALPAVRMSEARYVEIGE